MSSCTWLNLTSSLSSPSILSSWCRCSMFWCELNCRWTCSWWIGAGCGGSGSSTGSPFRVPAVAPPLTKHFVLESMSKWGTGWWSSFRWALLLSTTPAPATLSDWCDAPEMSFLLPNNLCALAFSSLGWGVFCRTKAVCWTENVKLIFVITQIKMGLERYLKARSDW